VPGAVGESAGSKRKVAWQLSGWREGGVSRKDFKIFQPHVQKLLASLRREDGRRRGSRRRDALPDGAGSRINEPGMKVSG